MARPLKVFAARLGFYDTVVAVPSQAAALRAWGTRQNLFADGVATVAEDTEAVEAARAHPGVPLKRGIGTGEPFSLNPSLPRLPDEPEASSGKPGGSRPTRARPVPKPAAPPPPDRSALEAAEREVGEVERRWRDRKAAFDARRAVLDAEQQRAEAEHDKELRQAEADQSREQSRFDAAASRARRG